MFTAPPEIEASVFARIPDKFHKSESSSVWVTAQRGGQPTPCFLEGPSFDRAGNLFVTDVPWGRIFRITPEGEVSLVFEYDGEPNGLKYHRDGRIFIADFRRGIMILDLKSQKIEPIADRLGVENFKGVNDLIFASNGDIYFTDQGHSGLNDPSGRVYRLLASGPLEIVLENIPSPNGLAFSPDEKTLYVNVTRDNAVWRVPLLGPSTPYKVGAFIRLSGGTGPDGLAVDQTGGLAVAHLGLGSVWIFDNVGEPILRIRCPGRAVTNLAYAVDGSNRLFITEGDLGQVLVADVPNPGLKLFSHI
jgi:gluconolactonase